MEFHVYSASLGITIAIIFEFIALISHVKSNKKESFLIWWVLGMGLTVFGLIASFAGTTPVGERISIIISNALTILGQGTFVISIGLYLNKESRRNKNIVILGLVLLVLLYFSVFIELRVIRMLVTSLVLFAFSFFIVRRLYLSITEQNKENIIFLMITFIINGIFWIFRFIAVIFLLPRAPWMYDFIVIMSYTSLLFVCTLGTLGLILLINNNLVNQITKEKLIVDKERLKFLTILETSPDFILVTDISSGKIELANNQLLYKMGYTNDEIIGKTTFELNMWDGNEPREKFVNDLKENKKLSNYENVFVKKDGSKFLGSMSVSIIEIDNKAYSVAMVRDISEIKEIEIKLKKSEKQYKELSLQLQKEKDIAEKNALTDGMTGLSNRRYLDEQIMLEYFRMKRTGENLSIIMLDVDFFKLYNDLYGHIQGDECLKSIAKLLKNSIKRATDIAARYGGEEFVILLPDTDEDGAKKVAETIRKNVEDLNLEHKDSKISNFVTVSLGVATFGSQSEVAPEKLVQKADEALYQAKNNGRNRVVQITQPIQSLEEESFLKVVWSSKFESGNEEIDNQHKKLFNDYNVIFANILSIKSNEDQLNSIMNLVRDLKEHFEYEEELLGSINYPDADYHAGLHLNLLNSVQDIIEKFQKDEVKVMDVLNFLIFEVISEHLYREDRLYFEYIKEL